MQKYDLMKIIESSVVDDVFRKFFNARWFETIIQFIGCSGGWKRKWGIPWEIPLGNPLGNPPVSLPLSSTSHTSYKNRGAGKYIQQEVTMATHSSAQQRSSSNSHLATVTQQQCLATVNKEGKKKDQSSILYVQIRSRLISMILGYICIYKGMVILYSTGGESTRFWTVAKHYRLLQISKCI